MKKGSILVASIIILTTLLTIALGVSSAVMSTTIKTTRAYRSFSALSFAEAGINKAIWEINQAGGNSYTGEVNNTTLSGGAFDVQIENTCGINCKQITATGYVPNRANPLGKKIVRVKVKDKPSSNGLAFSYGVQAGPLGIIMDPNSSISGTNGSVGNVYAQGTIIGANNTTVTGDVIMSGPSGKIDSIEIGGNAKAHAIVNSTIGKDAYYQSIDTKTLVRGTKCPNTNCHPASLDQPDIDLPITEEIINEWETTAQAHGTHVGDLQLKNDVNKGSVSLGPTKIEGNLTAELGTNLIITGTVWVTGNINLANNMTIVLDPGFGNDSAVIIADNLTNKDSYGMIRNSNNIKVCGSISIPDCQNNVAHPENTSSLMFLSTNTGSTLSNPAIIASNNSNAVIYYATTGMLEVSNNAVLKAFTGGGLHLSNGAQVIYDQGLASSQFSGGPGGSWAITEWQIIY